ncbi:MAG: hypothetical protein F6J90_41920 [Moorea sp. SIOASIH]|uniref:hypothetical protein n=1 Tax=Moorena sp. SIOASIH TaxID=2607817 RepID=UPI0013B7BABB|nr:hypothetical protein [Moorena sp. SIOASIH]NEO42529.1 hypothetical protein [Moorena sp. SIOASIH]
MGIQTNSSRHVGGVCFSLNVPTQMAVSKLPDAKSKFFINITIIDLFARDLLSMYLSSDAMA